MMAQRLGERSSCSHSDRSSVTAPGRPETVASIDDGEVNRSGKGGEPGGDFADAADYLFAYRANSARLGIGSESTSAVR